MTEEWRDVPGFEGLYQIDISTKEGRCRSLNYEHTGKPKDLSNKPGKRDSRILWHLCKNGKCICRQAAYWIAITYPELIQNEYFEGAEIDHKDTDRLNNHPSNLRWVTRRGNLNNPLTKQHMCSSQKGRVITEDAKNRMRLKLTNRKDQSKIVKQFSKDLVLVAEYESLNEAERQTGISAKVISKCCLGKPHYKTAGGFIWKYGV